ncbi:MAG: hypothetical protein OHK0050_21060 [Roseiflexaceae bacterium]
MPQSMIEQLDLADVQAFLATHVDPSVQDVAAAGAGAWSRCFRFRSAERDLVVRFGRHVDDFLKDRLAAAYAAPGLPIPQVLTIAPAFDGHYAISTRVIGEPLEQVPPEQWFTLLPAVVQMLDTMRMVELPMASGQGGYGSWDANGQAPFESWPAYLLQVGDDTPDLRTYGWKARLANSPIGMQAFEWGMQRLKQVARADTPRYLIHGDLINRNVLVSSNQISGVFDWGCGAYGDHLYDLAWFVFWAPWSPNLDIVALATLLEQHWTMVGYRPAHQAERLMACYLHIGIAHLAYNAYLGDWETLAATAERMYELIVDR